MSKPTAYIETSVVSYLTSRPSRDIVVAGQQQVTQQWWDCARDRYVCVVSEVVLREIRAGDAQAAERRLAVVRGFPTLAVTPEVFSIAAVYNDQLGLPERAAVDVLHIACCVSYRIEYLLTWNCKHIANGGVLERLRDVNSGRGWYVPLIVTPDYLLEV